VHLARAKQVRVDIYWEEGSDAGQGGMAGGCTLPGHEGEMVEEDGEGRSDYRVYVSRAVLLCTFATTRSQRTP
jgi:hypothetical protein